MVLGISDIPILLVIAGVVFIFIAIVREVSGYIKTSIDEKKAKILGIAGIILLASGIITAATGVFQPPEIKPTPTPPVTPSPSPTITPTPEVTIEITNPKEGAEASAPLTVEGKLEGELPEDWYLWTFYYNYEEWYPQNRIVPFEGEWKSNVWLGSQTDVEKDVAVVLADKDADSEFQQGEPLRILPQGAEVCDQITVIVREI
jgi:hypothetical protein